MARSDFVYCSGRQHIRKCIIAEALISKIEVVYYFLLYSL